MIKKEILEKVEERLKKIKVYDYILYGCGTISEYIENLIKDDLEYEFEIIQKGDDKN